MSKVTGLFSKIVGPAAVMAAGTMGALAGAGAVAMSKMGREAEGDANREEED